MLHTKQTNNNNPSSSASGSSSNSMDSSSYFAINRHTGWIYIVKPLDYESQDLHELVIIARDQGVQPLETSAFVSIRVTDINDNQPTVNMLYLTSNSKPEISENARIGDLVARISVNDADLHATSHSSSFMKKSSSSKRYSSYNGLSVSLFGAPNGEFGLKTADQIVYLIVVTGKLDREQRSKYQLTVIVSDKGYPPQNTSTTFELEVLDVNDNPPYFDQQIYHQTLMETADIGSNVFQMKANDLDSDSILTYGFLISKNNTNNNNDNNDDDDEMIYFQKFNQQNQTHQITMKTKWFQIDYRSGLITTRSLIDCEIDPEPILTIIVSDSLTTTTNKDPNSIELGFQTTTKLIISINDVSFWFLNF